MSLSKWAFHRHVFMHTLTHSHTYTFYLHTHIQTLRWRTINANLRTSYWTDRTTSSRRLNSNNDIGRWRWCVDVNVLVVMWRHWCQSHMSTDATVINPKRLNCPATCICIHIYLYCCVFCAFLFGIPSAGKRAVILCFLFCFFFLRYCLFLRFLNSHKKCSY